MLIARGTLFNTKNHETAAQKTDQTKEQMTMHKKVGKCRSHGLSVSWAVGLVNLWKVALRPNLSLDLFFRMGCVGIGKTSEKFSEGKRDRLLA